MIVHDLDIVSVAVPPDEAQAPLVVDPDAVSAGAISDEFFQAVARWISQIRGTPGRSSTP
jgi:hypothetical protein